jgi:hypothetical protein
MTEHSTQRNPGTEDDGNDRSIDPAKLVDSGTGVGGPDQGMETGAENAFTGNTAEMSQDGSAGSNPDPTGV